MRHRLSLRLLGQEGLTLAQSLFRMFTFSQIAPDTLHTDRFAVAKDQACTDFEPDTTSLLRDDVELVDRRRFINGLLGHHV